MTSHEFPGAEPGETPGEPRAAGPEALAAERGATPAEPAGAEQMPGTADSEGWRRLHPLSPLLRGGLVLVVLVGVIIANFRDLFVRLFFGGAAGAQAGEDEFENIIVMLSNGQILLIALGSVLALVLVIVGLAWVAWRFHSYRVTADAVESRSGVVFRQHRRAPLDRVQSVNLQRPLLARLLGLTKIEVLTGGQGGKVELAYLGHRDAKTVRERILLLATARRNGESVAQPIDEISAAAPVYYDGSAYAAPADALTQRAQEFADFDVDPEAAAAQALVRVPLGRLLGSILLSWEAVITLLLLLLAVFWGVVSSAIGVVTGSDGFLASGGISLLTVIPLILVTFGMMFSQFNKGFNFVLSRGRDSVRVGSGLTSTVTDSIPFGRIHAIEARQPLFWRPFGWWRVRVTLAGHSVSEAGQNVTQNIVLPVGRHTDVVRVIETLVPGAATGVTEGLTGPGDGYLRAGARAGWLLWFGKRRAGIRIDVPASTDGSAAPLTDATLRVRRGALTRTFIIMPIVRAQSVQLSRPLWHYVLGLASLQAHTVLGPVRVSVRGLGLADAQRFFGELSATMLAVQRAESDTHPVTRRQAHDDDAAG
ncbi:PH domain-containing protein [Leucobacter albus]|uniref:PH domain-containing protein n=1 Tax=Leucobacter albus TaxID=272210 RepID=A0ABW3TMK0_9MICO